MIDQPMTDQPMTERYGELRLMRRPDPLQTTDPFRSLPGRMIQGAATRVTASSPKDDNDDTR